MKKWFNRIRYSFVSMALFVLFSLMLVTISLIDFTAEDTLGEFFADELYQSNNLDKLSRDLFDEHKENCLLKDTVQTLPFNDINRTIGCMYVIDSTKETYGKTIVREVIFKELYDKKYQCTFVECLLSPETMGVIMSRQGNSHLQNTKTFLIFGTIICALLVLTLAPTVLAGINCIGWMLFLSGSSFITYKLFPNSSIISMEGINSSAIISGLMAPINTLLMIFFGIGIIMIVSYHVFKYIDKKK